ncbi:hypothetical protein CR513_46565, partial [Mucuna pruriens]
MNRHSMPVRPTPEAPHVWQHPFVNEAEEKFGTQYSTNRPYHLTFIALVKLRQGQSEPLHSFKARFLNISMKIRNLNPRGGPPLHAHGIEAKAILRQSIQTVIHRHGQSKDKDLWLHLDGRDDRVLRQRLTGLDSKVKTIGMWPTQRANK